MKIKQIDNLDNEIYHNSDEYNEYWSSSNIKEYLKTPREAYYQKNVAEHKDSEAFAFGNQLHDFLASKHVKGQPFEYNIFEPPVNPSTGNYYGKESQKYKAALSYIKNPISADDMEIINDIWSMIRSSGYAWFFEKEILGKGIAEPSFFIESGVHKYKYRPDVVTDKYLFDYKTITKKNGFKSNWNEQALSNRVKDFGYDISAAMYQYFEYERTGIWKPFIIIWIMKDPPYDVLIHDISYCCYEPYDGKAIVYSGANIFTKLKDQHELCQVANYWPGLANKFDKFRGIRLAEFTPRFENSFDEFEIED